MDFLVEFLDVGAKIIKDPTIIEAKKNNDNVILNPDISHLIGISPSFWVKDGDKVGHMGINESKEAVFTGKAFSPAFDDKAYFPEPIALNMIKLEQMVHSYDAQIKDIDAKRISTMSGLQEKLSEHIEVTAITLDTFEDMMKAMEKNYDKKVLKLQLTYFICLLGLFLLKFL